MNNLFYKVGVVAVWKADQRGRLQQNPVYQHNLQSPVNRCVFKNTSEG